MPISIVRCLLIWLLFLIGTMAIHAQQIDNIKVEHSNSSIPIILNNGVIELSWLIDNNGKSQLQHVVLDYNGGKRSVGDVESLHTVLFSARKPSDSILLPIELEGKMDGTPELHYHRVIPPWKKNLSPANLNVVGQEISYEPLLIELVTNTSLHLRGNTENFIISEKWSLDSTFKNDIKVNIILKAKSPGFYSIVSPSLFSIEKKDIQWGIIPGVIQGNYFNDDFVRAYAYGHGIPDESVVVRERTVTSLTSMMTTKRGMTVAATAEPGTGRDPWKDDKKTQSDWDLGLSLIRRDGMVMPTLYHPVLGEPGSYLNKGDSVTFSFRYTITHSEWYPVFKHVVNNVYRLPEFLTLKETDHSLTDRLYDMYSYVLDKRFSQWKTDTLDGTIIGAQRYLGGIYESNRDAIKNADYGAMWMLAKQTDDPYLINDILPFALNFKIKQQNDEKGFFHGAASGQYYLYESKKFTEEWGPYTEPVATTYYMLIDIGNILLFEPDNDVLRERLRNAADRLLAWMKPNGQWEVAYDNVTQSPMFLDLEDLRPTFYGLLVAYRILKDEKYLLAAQKGADWFIDNAVSSGRFIGVCGDTRFAPDFATAQGIEALLTLYEETRQKKYKEAAIRTAQIFITYIYTHPIPSQAEKQVRDQIRKDWEITQVGLNVEHGGTIGSANNRGPILLTSHAGLFVRLYKMTGDSLYLTLARTAVWGRDAFVDKASGVASYYWDDMDKGPGPYPHHAWWQIGWIMDYLLSEISLRSGDKIQFPSGFIAPKVGPHKTYGFDKGILFDRSVELIMRKNLVKSDSPHIEYVMAHDKGNKEFYIMLLNNSVKSQHLKISINPEIILEDRTQQLYHLELMGAGGIIEEQLDISETSEILFDALDLKILKMKYL